MEKLFEEDEQTETRNNSQRRNICNETAKENKSPFPDNIQAEILKLVDEDQLELLTNLLNKIYETGELPKDWWVYTFFPLPKKSNATRCSDNRIISLMSHALKSLLGVIHSRVYR